MKKQCIGFFAAVVMSSSVIAGTVNLPLSVLLQSAQPLAPNATCTNGLSFTLPIVAPDTQQKINITFSFRTAAPSGNICGVGGTVGSISFSGSGSGCIGHNRSGLSYCVSNASLSRLSSGATGGTGSWNSTNCVMLTDTAGSASSAITANCTAEGSCTNSGSVSGNLTLGSISGTCTPI